MLKNYLNGNFVNAVATTVQAIALLIFVISAGVIGFMLIEDYSLVEAFFMTVITVSTVGYREVKTLSPEGMMFTSILIITSFGLFAFVITSVTRYILDGGFRDYYKTNKLNKKLAKITDHVIVCGYGRNGKQAVEELLMYEENLILIDTSEIVLQEINKKFKNLLPLNGDATQDDVLERAQIGRAKALIATLPNDANNLFIVLTARQMNPNIRIISRASDEHSGTKLKRAGADNVIMPEKIGGSRMAKLISQPDIIEFLDKLLIRSYEHVNLVEIFCENMDNKYINKTIAELDIRRISGANLIGLKQKDGSYTFNPSPTHIINPDDKLFAIGTSEQIIHLKQVLLGTNTKILL